MLLSVNFVYAWKNYPKSTKAPFPSIDGKLFFFATVYVYLMYSKLNITGT